MPWRRCPSTLDWMTPESGSADRIPAIPGDEAVDGGRVVGDRNSLGERDGDFGETPVPLV